MWTGRDAGIFAASGKRITSGWLMKTLAVVVVGLVALAVAFPVPTSVQESEPVALPIRHMEHLGRGVVAINQGEGKVFVSWRLLGTDPDEIAFNVYRKSGDAEPTKLNPEPLTKAT